MYSFFMSFQMIEVIFLIDEFEISPTILTTTVLQKK